MEWVDTHCHIYLSAEGEVRGGPGGDVADVLARAEVVGVKRLVVVGIDPESSEAAVSIAASDPRCMATVGLHPNSAGRLSASVEESLRALACRPEVVGVGETGMDFYRMGADPTTQEEAFRFHIDLARQVEKPVVVHVREAHGATRRILEKEAEKAPLPSLVMHCFSGSSEDARAYLELGAYLSFAGPITFRTANARALREVAQAVPLERCLVETDSPFLSPHPYRGIPNEPARAVLVGEELARLKGLPAAEVARVTTENASAVFGWR